MRNTCVISVAVGSRCRQSNMHVQVCDDGAKAGRLRGRSQLLCRLVWEARSQTDAL